jgi:hypothetical protein
MLILAERAPICLQVLSEMEGLIARFESSFRVVLACKQIPCSLAVEVNPMEPADSLVPSPAQGCQLRSRMPFAPSK